MPAATHNAREWPGILGVQVIVVKRLQHTGPEALCPACRTFQYEPALDNGILRDIWGLTGCVRPGSTPTPPPHAHGSVEVEQNNTVAAFMLARGESAMLELPVAGAYEAMSSYDVDAAVLQLDFGSAIGAAKEASGVFTRQFSKGTVELDCNKWQSSFVYHTSNGT